MSRLWTRAVLWTLLFTAVSAGAAAGVAGAASVESMLEGSLAPSAAPALLGPITEAGRKGWACKPERAASTAQRSNAELPDAAAP